MNIGKMQLYFFPYIRYFHLINSVAEMISYPHVFELEGKTYLDYLDNQVGRHGFGLGVPDGKFE